MSKNSRKVHITCPTCQSISDVDLPFTSFDEHQLEKGLVTISLKIECGHACYVFIDKNFRMRGGQCADYELNSSASKPAPISDAQFQMSELLIKYAAEVIKMDVQDETFIKSIGAEEKIDSIENALIHGDIKKAGSIIDNLRRFSSEIDEKEFSNKLLNKIQSLNKIIINKPNIDWDLLILKDNEAKDEAEFLRLRGLHYDRLRKIVAELEFEVIEGRLSRDAVETKKRRLLDLMDKK